MSNPTKLLEIKSIGKTRRFQSQLYIGRSIADFVMEENIMKVYRQGKKGFDFYPYHGNYIIVKDIKEMKYQKL